MQSRIQELVELLPPPPGVRHTKGDWAIVESDLGTRLPDDFKDFTEAYGAVKICNCLCVHTPFPWTKEGKEFLLTVNEEYDKVVGGRKNIPFPDYPAPGGSFPPPGRITPT